MEKHFLLQSQCTNSCSLEMVSYKARVHVTYYWCTNSSLVRSQPTEATANKSVETANGNCGLCQFKSFYCYHMQGKVSGTDLTPMLWQVLPVPTVVLFHLHSQYMLSKLCRKCSLMHEESFWLFTCI